MPLRIAIISTPRTGNTWLRLLLMEAYAISGFAVHRPEDLNWAGLPEECVFQLHWRRTSAFVQRLHQEGFRVVCMTRDPLDLLVSILQFSLRDDSTLQWLDGDGGNEQAIQGAMPGSAAFLDYAAGPRAAALMAVSREWASAPDCIPVRYEDLVADSQGELMRIIEALNVPARRGITEVVEGATIPKLQVRTGAAHHFWQGRPGLWRTLLVRSAAERLAEFHHAYCTDLGYSCVADPLLSAVQADANWLSLIWPQVTEKLRTYKQLDQGLAEARQEILRLGGEYAAAMRGNQDLTRDNEDLAKSFRVLRDYCTSVERDYHNMQELLQATRKEFAEEKLAEQECLRNLQARLQGLGPTSLAMARWFAGVTHRIPGATTAVKKLLHLTPQENSTVS